MFEVISAFGTVGLTMDLTSEYNGLTELIIVIVMLFGKVGLLTMARAFILEALKISLLKRTYSYLITKPPL